MPAVSHNYVDIDLINSSFRGNGVGEPTWSLIRLRRAPVPTLMILEANSTPMVCEVRTRPVYCQHSRHRYRHESTDIRS